MQINNLADIIFLLEKKPNNQNFLNSLKNKEWQNISTHNFTKKVKNLAQNLKSQGFKKGSKIALFAPSSPDFLIFDLACQMIGAITIPMFTNISKENLEFQLEDSKPQYAFVKGKKNWNIIKQYKDKFNKIILTDSTDKDSISLKTLFQENPKKLTKTKILADDLATIIYTSGSTGQPKGVCLTHKNLASQIIGCAAFFPLHTSYKALSFLPLAHIFERMIAYYYLTQNISLYYADKTENIPNLLQEIKPNLFTTVPRLLEKIYSKILIKTEQAPFIKRVIGKLAIKYALSNFKCNHLKKIFTKLVYQKYLHSLGGNIDLVICGGAALDSEIYKFFTNIGLPLYQGYGLTESSPVISANCPKYSKIGSSGKLFSDSKVKINKDGEILAKGSNIMQGYLNNPKKTADTMENGWLKTGDLGHLDQDGFLFITGRKKELEKTSTGKYVAVNAIENELKKIPYIEQALVIAASKKFVSCLIFTEEKIENSQIKKDLAIINKKLNKWEHIQKFQQSQTLPSIKNNQLTPSMKIRREVILQKYKKDIEKLYQRHI